MVSGMYKSIHDFYDSRKIEIKLKGTDIRSNNFLIFAILTLLIIISYFLDEDTQVMIWAPCTMLLTGYLFHSLSLKKVIYQIIDERERQLWYKITAVGGYLFVLELFFGIISHQTLIAVLSQRGSSCFFLFLYIFNVSLVASFIFRKNEKEFKQSQEEK